MLFYEKALSLLATLDDCYPALVERYTEMLLLNGDLWSYSPVEIQLSIIDKVSIRFAGGSPPTVSRVLDSFLNVLEICVNQQEKENPQVIQRLVGVITKIVKANLTDDNISRLMGYANLYYVRRLPNYWLQLHTILGILLDIYISCIGRVN